MTLYIITGPPAAGKTTWVRQRAKPGDIVIDYDALAAALSGPGGSHWDHPEPVRAVTHRARAAAINEALKHHQQTDIYLIHSLPPADLVDRYADHHPQVITIDPGRDVVLQRIVAERPAPMRAVAERWYHSTPHTVQPPPTTSRHW